jgi:Tol biopolymer transport system component
VIDLGVRCNVDLSATFSIVNTGSGPMRSAGTYTISAPGQTPVTQSFQLNIGQSQSFVDVGNAIVTVNYSTSVLASVTLSVVGTCLSQPTATPTNTPNPPNLVVTGQCDQQAGTTVFTVTNTGGPMTSTATWTASDGTTGLIQLAAGGSQTFTVQPDASGHADFTVQGYPGASASTDNCLKPPDVQVVGQCDQQAGTTVFTVTNSGGPMSSSATWTASDGTTGSVQLAAGGSQTFSVQPDASGHADFTVQGYPGASANVDSCKEATETPPPAPTGTPVPTETPVPTTPPQRPVCGETSEVPVPGGGPGFPNVDMTTPCAHEATPTEKPWTPISIGEGVCPDWLVYHTNQTDDWEIFRLGEIPDKPDADTNLSKGIGERVYDVSPTRSPDSAWIAFASNRDGNWEIYIGATDGTFQQRVTYNQQAIDIDPVWSPVGNTIAFESMRDGNWELYLVDVATGAETRLTDDPADDINAFWYPDGSKLVFQSDRDGFWQIYELTIATQEVKRLSDGQGDDHFPQYSFDGTKIAFQSFRDGDNGVIYVMDADGSNVQRISDVNGSAALQVWSPDDSVIAYQSDLDGDLDIYVYELASGKTRQVTDNDSADYAPTWFCRSTTLVFTSDITDDSNLYSTPALPIDAPAIKVEDEASQLTDEPKADQYPQNSPPEEDASRQNSLPFPAKNR